MPFPDNHPATHLSPLSPPAPELTGRQTAPRPSKHRDPAPSYGDLEAPAPGAFCAARAGSGAGPCPPTGSIEGQGPFSLTFATLFSFQGFASGKPSVADQTVAKSHEHTGREKLCRPWTPLGSTSSSSELVLGLQLRRPRSTEAEKPREQVPRETSRRPGRTGCRSCRALEPSVKNLLSGRWLRVDLSQRATYPQIFEIFELLLLICRLCSLECDPVGLRVNQEALPGRVPCNHPRTYPHPHRGHPPHPTLNSSLGRAWNRQPLEPAPLRDRELSVVLGKRTWEIARRRDRQEEVKRKKQNGSAPKKAQNG